MSFILDALKKSETERQRQSAAEFATVPSSAHSPRVPRWLWLLGALLAINLAVLTGMLLRDDRPTALPASIEMPPPAEPDEPAPSFAERLEDARRNLPPRQAPAESVGGSPANDASSGAAAAPTTASRATPDIPLEAYPTLDQLRLDGALQLAELHLDIHVYSDVPAGRFVFINMAKYREDSRLAEGPVVREITPDGVVLDYQGTSFLLPRE